MARTTSGGCLCGACRYATDASPINVRVCHCRKCQRAIGASFNARVLVPLDALKISGPVAWYPSSKELRRGFCPRCGTSLFSERQANSTIGITLGSLDDPNAFAPSVQVWVSSKQAWLALNDPLTCYTDAAPTR